jgi:recombination protein RecT
MGNQRRNIKTQTKGEEMEKSLTKNRALDLRDLLQSEHIKNQMAAAVPKWFSVDRLLRIVISEAMNNPKILECSQASILQSVMRCAQFGLEPFMGRAYLIPYNNRRYVNGKWTKQMELQFQPGYQGLIELAKRNPDVLDVRGRVVHELDEFDMDEGLEMRVHFKRYLKGDPGEMVGAFAVWDLANNVKHFEFMPAHDIYKRRAKSQAFAWAETGDPKKGGGKKDSIWHQWPDEQSIKTVIKYSTKFVPASIDFMEAVQLDNAVEAGEKYVDPMSDRLSIPERSEADLVERLEVADVFNLAVKNKIDPSHFEAFEAFIAEVAEQNGVDVQTAKKNVTNMDDFDNMIEAFGKWQHGGNRQPAASSALDEGHPFFRDKWVSKKAGSLENNSGLWAYVRTFKNRLSEVPDELYQEMGQKFASIYGRPFPFDRTGKEIEKGEGDSMAQGEIVEPAASQAVKSEPENGEKLENVLNSPEAAQLAEISKRFPNAYREIVAGKTPTSIEQIKQWIVDVDDCAKFTDEPDAMLGKRPF